MDSSPLELYARAYRLQYEEERADEATEIYEKIVREFPDSNECAYSVIQLQKLKANDIFDSLGRSKRSRASRPLILATLILNVLTILGIGVLATLYVRNSNLDTRYVSGLAQAIGKLYAGQEREALRELAQLKQLRRGDIGPFLLSARIYSKQGRYEKAMDEFVQFHSRYPSVPVPREEIAALKHRRRAAREAFSNRRTFRPADARSESETTGVAAGDQSSPSPPETSSGAAQPPGAGDSVSFF